MADDIQPLSTRTWRSLLMAVGTMVLIGWGVMHFAAWIRERDEVLDTTQQSKVDPAPAAAPTVGPSDVDPLLAAYMYPTAKYSAPRKTPFGSNTAWMLVGYTPDAPNFVFARLIKSDDPKADEAALRAAMRQGPSAQIALRAHAFAGAAPWGAFLVQMAPDATAFAAGRCRMERGAVTLGFQGANGWRYVTYYFPDGLDFDNLQAGNRATDRSLEHLGPSALTHLDPQFVLDPTQPRSAIGDGSRNGPLRTVLCRARATPAQAVDGISRDLVAAGWQRLAATEPGAETTTHVLAGRDVQVWMTTPEPTREGGMVSVMITRTDG